MKFKLSRSEMFALTQIVDFACKSKGENYDGEPIEDTIKRVKKDLDDSDNSPPTFAEQLIIAMMERLREDLIIKTIRVKKHYSLDWHPERCLAFAAVFEGVKIDKNNPQKNIYEITLVLKIMDIIRRKTHQLNN